MKPEDLQAVSKFNEYLDAANNGDLDAIREVAKCYYYGEGVSVDKGESLKWCHSAAEKGDAFSQWMLGSLFYLRGDAVPKDDLASAKWLRSAYNSWMEKAKHGDVDSQCSLARMLLAGEGVGRNPDEAFKWLKIAGDNGSTWAMHILIESYFFGPDVLPDHGEAMKWALKYAELRGHEKWMSLAYYARKFTRGISVRQDNLLAIKLLRIGVSYGDAKCYALLGDFLNEGIGADVDIVGAFTCWLRGAQLGDADAQLTLGDAYSEGRYVEKDPIEASYWYRRASKASTAKKIKVCEKLFGLPGFGYEAEKMLEELLSFVPQQRYYDDLSVGGCEMLRLGDFLASKVTPPKPDLAIKCYENILKINAGWAGFAWFGLAKLYMDGVGVIRNQSEAVNLWVKSAMLGHPGACHELGLAYHLASGVGLDLVEAYAWFNNAHALGFTSSAQKVSEIERQLSPAQITVAQSRSASLNALIQRGIEAERKLLLGG